MPLSKVHRLDFTDGIGFPSMGTHCGMQGGMAKNSDNEFETMEGFRYEVTNDWKKVTCKRCLRSRPTHWGKPMTKSEGDDNGG